MPGRLALTLHSVPQLLYLEYVGSHLSCEWGVARVSYGSYLSPSMLQGNSLMKPVVWFFALILLSGAASRGLAQQVRLAAVARPQPRRNLQGTWSAQDMAKGRAVPRLEGKGTRRRLHTASIAAGLVFGMGDRGNDEVVWALAKRTARKSGPPASDPSISGTAARERGTGLHADGRRRFALRLGPRGRPGLPAFRRRQGRLAQESGHRFWRKSAGLELSRISPG